MRTFCYILCTLGLSVLVAALAVAQSDAPKTPQTAAEAAESNARPKSESASAKTREKADKATEKTPGKAEEKIADKADKAKDTPGAPAKPVPVKYTELKKTL